MSHLLLSLIAASYLLHAMQASEPAKPENWQIFQNATPPVFKIIAESKEYLPGEAITVRCILKNDTAQKIPVHHKYLERESYSVSVGLLQDINKSAISQPILSIGTCWRANVELGYTYLAPGEQVIGDFILGTLTEKPGKYYLTATYFWREHNPKTPNEELFKYQFIKADPLPIIVAEPNTTEKEAARSIEVPNLLNYLQTPLYGCTRLCGDVKDVPCEDTKEFYLAQAKKFTDRFPKSAYAQYMNYTMGMILKDQKNYQAAEEQMGRFITLYPNDWLVDDAMFEMSECQIEQGKPDKAQASLESLFQKYPLTSAHRARRVLENLKKGYKTMGEIYGH